MLVSILGFSRFSIAYKWKFNVIHKQYKDDKIANGISSNDRHECPFYDALDYWWHQSKNVMKHVNISTIEIEEVIGSQKSQTYFDNVSRDEWNELMEKHFTLDEVLKKKKTKV